MVLVKEQDREMQKLNKDEPETESRCAMTRVATMKKRQPASSDPVSVPSNHNTNRNANPSLAITN
jgi:hypothetical protein